MNIALLTEKYPPDPGGLAVSVARLARLLAASASPKGAASHRVHVFAPSSALAPGEIASGAQSTVYVERIGVHKRADDTLAAWSDALAAAHARAPFDVLHAYFVTQAGFLAVYAGRVLGVPSVVSARGNDLDRAVFDPGKAAHTLYALQHAGAVTANSRDLLRKAQALAPGRAVTLVPNGVDTALFAPGPPDPALRRALGLGDLPVIGFVGEARAKKGLATLLLAARAVSASCLHPRRGPKGVAQRRPVTLLLAGGVRSGDDADLLKVFRKQNPDLPVMVVPHQPLEAMPAIYQLIDVLALPSLHDGLPNALLEGMACARAIVATPAGGIPDALQDGANGALVPPGDAAALAAALEALLADDARRARLGAAARETVLQEYTLERELAGTLAVYREVLGAA
jgi:glycosyltransferase involved in cell wall biosynthesis